MCNKQRLEVKSMVSFESDYIAGAHPEIIKKLGETNLRCLRTMRA